MPNNSDFATFYKNKFGKNEKEKVKPKSGPVSEPRGKSHNIWRIPEPQDLFEKVINEGIVTTSNSQEQIISCYRKLYTKKHSSTTSQFETFGHKTASNKLQSVPKVHKPSHGHAPVTEPYTQNHSKTKKLLEQKIERDLQNLSTVEKFATNLQHQIVNLNVDQTEELSFNETPDKSGPAPNEQKSSQNHAPGRKHGNNQSETKKFFEQNYESILQNSGTVANQKSAPNVFYQISNSNIQQPKIEKPMKIVSNIHKPEAEISELPKLSQGAARLKPHIHNQREIKTNLDKTLIFQGEVNQPDKPPDKFKPKPNDQTQSHSYAPGSTSNKNNECNLNAKKILERKNKIDSQDKDTVEKSETSVRYLRANSNLNQPKIKQHMSIVSDIHTTGAEVTEMLLNKQKLSRGHEPRPQPNSDNQREKNQFLKQKIECDLCNSDTEAKLNSTFHDHNQTANSNKYIPQIEQNMKVVSKLRKTGFEISELLRDKKNPSQGHHTPEVQIHKESQLKKILDPKIRDIYSLGTVVNQQSEPNLQYKIAKSNIQQPGNEHMRIGSNIQKTAAQKSELLPYPLKQNLWPAYEPNIHELAMEYVPELGPKDKETVPNILKLGSWPLFQSDNLNNNYKESEPHNNNVNSWEIIGTDEPRNKTEIILLHPKKERNIRDLDRLRAVRNQKKREPNIYIQNSNPKDYDPWVEANIHKFQVGTNLNETEKQTALDLSISRAENVHGK